MWKKVREFISAPVFPDDEKKTRRAKALNALQINMGIALLVLDSIGVMFFFKEKFVTSLILVIGVVVILVSMWLNRLSYTTTSGWIILVFLWLLTILMAVLSGGVRSLDVTFFISGTVIAGIVLGGRGTVFYAVLSLLTGLGLIAIENAGFVFPHLFTFPPFAAWMIMLINLVFTVIPLQVALQSLDDSISRATASEERYRLIASVVSDYAFSTRFDANGNIIDRWLEGAFETITGYTPDEHFAQGGWKSLVHPDDVEQDKRDMAKLSINQNVISDIRIIRKDGEVRFVRSYARPKWDEKNDRLAGIYGAVKDVTESTRIESEREKLILELETKNAELERFTYTVSHDLRSPLVTIKGYLGYLDKHFTDRNTERFHYDLDRIGRAATKMDNLLRNLLELSRIGRITNKPQEISFDDIIKETLEIVHGRLEQARITLQIHSDLPSVYGDRPRLVEVLQNLIDNAAKYMGTQDDPVIEIGWNGFDDRSQPIFFVRDNGMGIAPEFHERIFGLFNKLDVNSEGTGVGLALVRRIIEFHGGRIWVQSKESLGSAFYFSLPQHKL